MRRGDAAVLNKGNAFDFQVKSVNKNVPRSALDVGDRGSTNVSMKVSQDVTYSPKNSPLDIVVEPIGQSSLGRRPKTSSSLTIFQSDLNIKFHDLNETSTVSSPDAREAEEDFTTHSVGPAIQRSFNVSKRQTDISNVPLPSSAALFYYGPSPQMEIAESCANVYKLNMHLKARRDDVNSGVLGKFLHAITGPDVTDVGSVTSTIAYAFYVDGTHKSNQFCSVPVINTKRADLDSRADLQWLFHSCHIYLSSLIFIDEIDLSYYDLFGSLKLVLLNCDNVPSQKEASKEAIVEVFHCTKDVLCCTAIAEKFAKTSPEILAGQGFSRLLLAGILLDTGNLSSSNCTSKDIYMSTLLINGAVKHKRCGSYDLKVEEILHKKFKKWTSSGKPNNSSSSRLQAPNIRMSSIGKSVVQLLSHGSTSIQEITQFQKSERLGILMVVSSYYDSQEKFKVGLFSGLLTRAYISCINYDLNRVASIRIQHVTPDFLYGASQREILACAESAELLKNLQLS